MQKSKCCEDWLIKRRKLGNHVTVLRVPSSDVISPALGGVWCSHTTTNTATLPHVLVGTSSKSVSRQTAHGHCLTEWMGLNFLCKNYSESLVNSGTALLVYSILKKFHHDILCFCISDEASLKIIQIHGGFTVLLIYKSREWNFCNSYILHNGNSILTSGKSSSVVLNEFTVYAF